MDTIGKIPADIPPTTVVSPTGAGIALPQLSLGGNLVGLGVNVVVAWWAWKRGGWWKLLAATNAASAFYFIGKIQTQV